MTRPLELVHHAKVVSLNAERSAHWTKRHELTQSWREAFYFLALQARHDPFEKPVVITAQPYQAKNTLADAGNALPSVKAGVDGIVDAGLLPDDSPDWVSALLLMAPKRGDDGLVLYLVEEP